MTTLPDRPSSTSDNGQLASLATLVTQADGIITVLVHGELDLASAPGLVRQVLSLLPLQVESIRLDLGAVEFMDSSGLHALLTLRNAGEEHHVPVSLTAVPDDVCRLLDVTGMAELFQYD